MILDLFAGAGGWDEGTSHVDSARVAGMRAPVTSTRRGWLIVGIDNWLDACRTATMAGHARICADVASYPTAPFVDRVTGLVASPPCTVFSTAGSGAGRQVLHILCRALDELAAGHTTRAARRRDCQRVIAAWARHRKPKLTRAQRAAWAWAQARSAVQVLEPLRYARDLHPEWLCLEQVRAVLPIWQHVARILRGWGYSVWTGILNSADFGVPQTRERAILIASRVRAAAPPEPTHAKDPQPALFGERARWVSMAEALGWHGVDRPARTVCGDRAPRWMYGPGNSYATGWTLELRHRRDSAAWVADHGTRADREAVEPAPTVTGEAARWELDRRTNSRGPQGTVVPVAPVPVDEPAPTLTSKSGGQWMLRNNTNANASERGLDEPAGTLFFGGRANDVSWVLRSPRHSKKADRTKPRRPDQPAPTVAFGHSAMEWVRERPATTVLGDARIAQPGHHGNTRHHTEDAIRITIAEAAILQSFPADYPWCGTRTSVFQQIGNAFPPRLAAAVIVVAAGLALPEAAAA